MHLCVQFRDVVLERDGDLCALDAWRRSLVGTLLPGDGRLRCVASETLGRTEEGQRVVRLAYMGVV